MKGLIIVLGLMIVSGAYAAQVDTECPWMKEQNERSNPKAQSAKIQKLKLNSKAVRK